MHAQRIQNKTEQTAYLKPRKNDDPGFLLWSLNYVFEIFENRGSTRFVAWVAEEAESRTAEMVEGEAEFMCVCYLFEVFAGFWADKSR